jgi:hypothetical protein
MISPIFGACGAVWTAHPSVIGQKYLIFTGYPFDSAAGEGKSVTSLERTILF